jgi:hypothetical protein
MKPRQKTFLLIQLVSAFLLACGISAPANGVNTSPNIPAAGKTSQPAEGFDPTQAGLPADVPVYPGAHDYTGIPSLMLDYIADADVKTLSEFYTNALNAAGWSGISTGGAIEASCGGDCGPVPSKTPGATPTTTPNGWMSENTQMWTKGSLQVIILFQAKPDGTTDVTITFISQ